jgi:hypothetical protein
MNRYAAITFITSKPVISKHLNGVENSSSRKSFLNPHVNTTAADYGTDGLEGISVSLIR